jgi:hypothetical protein
LAGAALTSAAGGGGGGVDDDGLLVARPVAADPSVGAAALELGAPDDGRAESASVPSTDPDELPVEHPVTVASRTTANPTPAPRTRTLRLLFTTLRPFVMTHPLVVNSAQPRRAAPDSFARAPANFTHL